LSLISGAAYLLHRDPPSWWNETSVWVPTLTARDLPPLDPSSLIVPPKFPPPGATLDLLVQPSDTLDRLFRRFGLNTIDLAEIRALDGVRDKLDQLRPGERIIVVQDQGAI
jgi:hypothetical protein